MEHLKEHLELKEVEERLVDEEAGSFRRKGEEEPKEQELDTDRRIVGHLLCR